MIILASRSASRRDMLEAAGVSFTTIPADLDERAVEGALGDVEPGEVARALAEAKALTVSRDHHGALVLGSDSLVEIGGRRFDKPANQEEAAEHLRFFSGKHMHLHSAASLARDGSIVFSHAEVATMAVRELSERFISSYLDREWPEVGYCVGVFRLEGLGVHLFESIEGSHFTVLGMPLLNVLAALRAAGELPR